MILWHILTEKRFAEKAKFAQLNQGNLLFTQPRLDQDISNGKLGEFLYCLPRIGGGAAFVSHEPLRAIRIELTDNAKVVRFSGNPDEIDYLRLKQNADALDMQIWAPPHWSIRFRQILIWNPASVKSWSTDQTDVWFQEEFNALLQREVSRDDFFMNDFSFEEQIAQAELLGRSLGVEIPFTMSQEDAEGRVAGAHVRLSRAPNPTSSSYESERTR